METDNLTTLERLALAWWTADLARDAAASRADGSFVACYARYLMRRQELRDAADRVLAELGVNDGRAL